ncbi:hypothetical protein N9B34_00100 [Akkermansiaceae bacterium]|nr:hypothetical protein [Akkermansiaceae bacterium]
MIGPVAIVGVFEGNMAFAPLLVIGPGLALLALLFQRIAPAT